MEIPLALYSFCFALYFFAFIFLLKQQNGFELCLHSFLFTYWNNRHCVFHYARGIVLPYLLICLYATDTPCGIFPKRPLPQPPAVSGPKAARLPASIRSDS